MDLPQSVVRRQIVSALDLIVQQARLRDGSRKVTHITEVVGLESDTVVLQDVFKFEEQGEQDGKVIGELEPVGIRPTFMPRLSQHGYNLPASVFMKGSPTQDTGRRGRRRR
jgi:pilus assembly protein CpaF